MKVPVQPFPTTNNWRFTGAVKLRIYVNQSFWNSDGQYVPQGIPGRAETAYLEENCEVTGGDTLIVPQVELDSTVDGLDNVFATYDAELVAGNRRIPFLRGFPVNTLEPGDPSTTWPEIIILRNLFEPQTLDDNLTRQLASLVQVAAGNLNKANSINTGVTALTYDPVDPGFPIAVGDNDPRWSAIIGTRIVYASAYGAALDSDLINGGGTDDTAIIQSLLDFALVRPVRVIIDGPALVGALNIHSNTTLEFINGGGFYLKTGTNRALLRNANPIGSGAVTDKHISLINGTFNGNYAGQTGVGSVGTREANGTLIGLVQMYGVDDVEVHSCKFLNSKSLGLHFANWTNVDLANLYFDNNVVGQHQQGGVEFEGPGSWLTARGIRGTTQDDLFTLASDGGAYIDPPFTGLGPFVGVGDITDVHVSGLVGIGNTLSAVRFFNGASRIDRVVIDGITGTFTTAVFWNESGLTPGNVGTVSISHVNVHLINSTVVWPFQYAFGLWGSMDHLILNDITFNDPEDNRGHLFFDNTADIKHLEVNGFRVYDTVDRTSTVLVFLDPDAKVRKADFRDIVWHRGATHTRAGRVFLINPNCIVEDWLIDGVYANRVDNILERNTVVLTNSITMRNIRHIDPASAFNVAFFNVTGTVSVLDMSNWYSDLAARVFNGGVITAKRGDAFTTYGSAVLVAGAVTVPYLDAAAGTKVFVNRLADGGTVGASYSVTRIPGTSFTITSKDGTGANQALDTSTVAYEIRD